jgi:lipopolysaccharide export LptBFGC system permease protein LptF
MFKIKKKYIIETILIILVLFLFLMFVFFIFNNKSSGTSNSSKSNSISITFSDNSTFSINNILPLSDKLGSNLDISDIDNGVESYSEITIYNDSDENENFDLYLTKISSNNDIGDNFIKIYLCDENDNPLELYSHNSIPTYKDLSYLSDKPDSKLLYSGVIASHSSIKYSLRVWLSDSYAMNDKDEEFNYKVQVKTT